MYFSKELPKHDSPKYYGAERTKMRNCRVHDHNFMKFGHQIACRDTNHLQKSNDLDMTSNYLKMSLNFLFSSYLTFS